MPPLSPERAAWRAAWRAGRLHRRDRFVRSAACHAALACGADAGAAFALAAAAVLAVRLALESQS